MSDQKKLSNGTGRLVGATALLAGGLLLSLAVMGSGLRAADDAAAKVEQPASSEKSEAKSVTAASQKKETGKAGETRSVAAKPNAAKRDAKRTEQKFAERSQAVIAFAREHHPELADLLTGLEMTDAKQFATAVHELERDVERLMRLKENSSPQYDLAVQKWQHDSRIRLIVARLSMNDSSELEAELRAAVADRAAVREQELRDELVRLRKRIESNEKQLKELAENRDKVIDREVSLMRKSAGVARDRLKKQQAAVRKTTEKADVKTGDAAKREPTKSETAKSDKNKKPAPGQSKAEAVRADADSKETTGKESGT